MSLSSGLRSLVRTRRAFVQARASSGSSERASRRCGTARLGSGAQRCTRSACECGGGIKLQGRSGAEVRQPWGCGPQAPQRFCQARGRSAATRHESQIANAPGAGRLALAVHSSRDWLSSQARGLLRASCCCRRSTGSAPSTTPAAVWQAQGPGSFAALGRPGEARRACSAGGESPQAHRDHHNAFSTGLPTRSLTTQRCTGRGPRSGAAPRTLQPLPPPSATTAQCRTPTRAAAAQHQHRRRPRGAPACASSAPSSGPSSGSTSPWWAASPSSVPGTQRRRCR